MPWQPKIWYFEAVWSQFISPAKIGLFRINKELQFGIRNHGKPHASSKKQGEEKLFYRGKEEVERTIVNKESIGGNESPMCRGFSLVEFWQSLICWVSCPRRRGSLSSSCWALLLMYGLRTPPFGLWLQFNEVSIY